MLGVQSHAVQTDRREAPREEVYHRARAATGNGTMLALEIVNISASGFMARTEEPFAEGDTIRVTLPVIGDVAAGVRWSLGGRIGCEFPRRLDVAPYLELLGRLMRG